MAIRILPMSVAGWLAVVERVCEHLPSDLTDQERRAVAASCDGLSYIDAVRQIEEAVSAAAEPSPRLKTWDIIHLTYHGPTRSQRA